MADSHSHETWRDEPELVEFKAGIEEYFSGIDNHSLASQLGAILETELIESGQIENNLSRNQGNVSKSLMLLLDSGLKPDEDRTFLETDRTRIGREACVNEFMKRIVAKNVVVEEVDEPDGSLNIRTEDRATIFPAAVRLGGSRTVKVRPNPPIIPPPTGEPRE